MALGRNHFGQAPSVDEEEIRAARRNASNSSSKKSPHQRGAAGGEDRAFDAKVAALARRKGQGGAGRRLGEQARPPSWRIRPARASTRPLLRYVGG